MFFALIVIGTLDVLPLAVSLIVPFRQMSWRYASRALNNEWLSWVGSYFLLIVHITTLIKYSW
ncbi:hypothetical protein QR685DRAFT_532506 [Neurospora intermedia]|uniref:Uncharacterized protein n=1 Tax=Neurospora intermedia TaxID=5142 RepID=A0ABR3D539_NEUIN